MCVCVCVHAHMHSHADVSAQLCSYVCICLFLNEFLNLLTLNTDVMLQSRGHKKKIQLQSLKPRISCKFSFKKIQAHSLYFFNRVCMCIPSVIDIPKDINATCLDCIMHRNCMMYNEEPV